MGNLFKIKLKKIETDIGVAIGDTIIMRVTGKNTLDYIEYTVCQIITRPTGNYNYADKLIYGTRPGWDRKYLFKMENYDRYTELGLMQHIKKEQYARIKSL